MLYNIYEYVIICYDSIYIIIYYHNIIYYHTIYYIHMYIYYIYIHIFIMNLDKCL